MAVTLESLGFAADDDAGFGVCLESPDSIHHLHSAVFQLPCPLDVAGFIEASLQFHDYGDVLAIFRSADERFDDGAVATGAVQRLFDGHHIPIISGLGQQPQHGFKGFVRMKQQDILRLDGVEN